MATPKGITIGIGADASEFKKEIKEIGKGLSQTQKDINQLARGLKLEFDNESFLRAQKLTQDAIEQTETKAKRLRERIQELESAGQMDTTHYRWVQSELVKTDTQAKRLKNTLEEINQIKYDKIGKTFEDLGSKMSKIGSSLAPISAAAAALGTGLLAAGKSAVESAAKIKELNQEGKMTAEMAAKLGIFTKGQISTLNRFNDEITKIKTILVNLKNQIGMAMLPVMQSLASIMNDKIIPALSKTVNWFSNLSTSTKSMIMGALAFTAALAPMLIMGGKLATGVGAITKSLGGLKVALTSLTSHPIVAIIALVAALLMMLYAKNEAFRNSVNDLVKTMGESLQPVLEVVSKLLKAIVQALNPVIEVLGNILAPIIDLLNSSLSFQMRILGEQAKVIGQLLIPVILTLGRAFEFVAKIVEKVFKNVMKGIETVINWVIDKVNWLIEKLNTVVEFFGGTGLKTINKIDITGKTIEQKATNLGDTTNEIITYGGANGTYDNRVYNTDQSTKNITLELTVNNYGEKVDPDELVEQINRKLAEAM